MKRLLILGMTLTFAHCKSDPATSLREASVLDSLGYEDYREIVRHPVSLDNSLDSNEMSQITFENSDFHFDTIEAGIIVNSSFSFQNTGSKPLYILDTRVSCGCTVVEHPTSAISPGESGSIDIEFDTKEKSGFQQKSITILTNSYPNEHRLKMIGYVKNDNQ